MNMIFLIFFAFKVLGTFLVIELMPAFTFDTLHDIKNEKKSLWKYIFTKDIFLPLFFAFIPTAIHDVLQYVVVFLFKFFSKNPYYDTVAESKNHIALYYLILCYVIFFIVGKLYYTKFYVPSINQKRLPLRLKNDVIIENHRKKNSYEISYLNKEKERVYFHWVERNERFLDYFPRIDSEARKAVGIFRDELKIAY